MLTKIMRSAAVALAVLFCFVVAPAFVVVVAVRAQSKTTQSDKFKQLEEILPTPNEQRAASGAPGRAYWQQRADYQINVELDDVNQRIAASETITYHNQSPDALAYLWLQLDQNIWKQDSDSRLTQTAPNLERLPLSQIENMLYARGFDGGYRITAVRDARSAPLKHTINGTMMRAPAAGLNRVGPRTAAGRVRNGTRMIPALASLTG